MITDTLQLTGNSTLDWSPVVGYNPAIVPSRETQPKDVGLKYIELLHDEAVRSMHNISSLYRGYLQRTNLVIPQAADAVFSGIGQR